MYCFNIISSKYNCSIPLERRITVLRGDSGTGKSTVIDMIEANDPTIFIECKAEDGSFLHWVVLSNTTWEFVIRGATNSLLILDDLELIASPEFSKAVSETVDRNNYYLIMSREDNKSEENLSIKLNLHAFSISLNSIYNFNKSNTRKEHFVLPRYVSSVIEDPDCVIVEDAKAGKVFFEQFFSCKVVSAGGKGNIADMLLCTVEQGYKKILVFFDSAAFGCHADDFMDVINLIHLNYSEVKVGYFVEYESFEYFLLTTRFFKDNAVVVEEWNNPIVYANKYISWEHYFEDLLYRVSMNLPYSHRHDSELKDCYYKMCRCSKFYNRYRCNKCFGNKLLYKDKVRYLLRGTKFDCLLAYYHRKSVKVKPALTILAVKWHRDETKVINTKLKTINCF